MGDRVLERLLGRLFCSVLRVVLLRWDHFIPVLDEPQVFLDEPDVSVVEVVKGDHGAIHPELQAAVFRNLGDVLHGRLLPIAHGEIALYARPGGVIAAFEEHRCGRLPGRDRCCDSGIDRLDPAAIE